MSRKTRGSGLFNFCSYVKKLDVENKQEAYCLRLRVMWRCNPDEYKWTIKVGDSKETFASSDHRKFSNPENAIKEIRRSYNLHKKRLERLLAEGKQITETFFKD